MITLLGFQHDFGTPEGICPICGVEIGQDLIKADQCPECNPERYAKYLEKKTKEEN